MIHAPAPNLFTAATLCGTTGHRDARDTEVTCWKCRELLLEVSA